MDIVAMYPILRNMCLHMFIRNGYTRNSEIQSISAESGGRNLLYYPKGICSEQRKDRKNDFIAYKAMHNAVKIFATIANNIG